MPPRSLPRKPAVAPDERPSAAAEPVFDLIELLFFAYRDFVGEADAELASLGFGRAHHRVLHFVDRNPGLRVADLLDVLRITKQSLARVLRQLVDSGCIVQEAGATDRRERRLRTTPKGQALARRLATLQSARISRALAQGRPEADEIVRRFLFAMIAPEDRDSVAALIGLDVETLMRRRPS